MGLPFDDEKREGSKKLIIYYATQDNDNAYEDAALDVSNPDDRRGYFSKALIECLSSAVDPEFSYVTSVSLARSVGLKVQELSKGKIRPPQICWTEGVVNPPLRFGPRRRNGYPVIIRIVSGVHGKELQLQDGSLNVIESFFPKAIGDQWPRTLPPGYYGLVWADAPAAADKEKTFKVTNKPEYFDV